MATSPLLRSRVSVPRLPEGCLPRSALVERVRILRRRRVLSVVAGAGWGKSLLLALAAAAAQGAEAWAWVGLDEQMQSPPLLLGYSAAGLAQRIPGFGADLESTPPPAQAAAFLAEREQALDEDVVLVLDDVHALGDSPAATLLAALLPDLPERLHLILAARTEPALPLARLRAEGQVAELGEADLALDVDETQALLESLGRKPDREQAAVVQRRTEGWAAGISLVAQAAGDAADLDGAPDHRYVFDYMAEQVLSREPREIQEFLLATAVPERVNPDLASVISGRPAREYPG